MARWNVELKYQTTVEADSVKEAYDIAKEEIRFNTRKVFNSHCKLVKS